MSPAGSAQAPAPASQHQNAVPENPTKDGIVCRSCYGQGYIPPSPADYDFPVEILQDFVHFLRYCGGFEIW